VQIVAIKVIAMAPVTRALTEEEGEEEEDSEGALIRATAVVSLARVLLYCFNDHESRHFTPPEFLGIILSWFLALVSRSNHDSVFL
jgi:hypothetical protein